MSVFPISCSRPRAISTNCRLGASLLLAAVTSACGSGGGSTQALAPTIVTQPANQETTVGLTATFTVNAAGTGPFQYQWSKNGTAIAGASGASYTTPAAAPTDNGANFTVIVTNAIGSATSAPASLTVGPRVPKPGDWRFQALDLPAFVPLVATFLLGGTEVPYPNAIGTPLSMGAAPAICVFGIVDDCAWGYSVYAEPAGGSAISAFYLSDSFPNLDADLQALATPNNVITSLDLEPANSVFAVSWLQTTAAGGFSAISQSVASADVQAVASQLGEQSQVVTALTFNAGQVQILAYGWQGDTTTIYEATAVAATGDNFITEATSLAAAGYIITALGGDPTDGLILVGTRVQGDTMSRPIQFVTPSGTQGQLDKTVQFNTQELFTSAGQNWIYQQ
jgi:immunoglobulin I-set domain protein